MKCMWNSDYHVAINVNQLDTFLLTCIDFIPVRISNHIASKVWDTIQYPL